MGDFEAAVTLLLATPPNNPLFYMDALRAVSLASAVSTGLHELAVKVDYLNPLKLYHQEIPYKFRATATATAIIIT